MAISRKSIGNAARKEDELRAQLATLLESGHAHVTFDDAVKGMPASARGRRPSALPYSAWELLEHLRIAQADILEFCRSAKYVEKKWPDDYWPQAPAPPSAAAWGRSIAAFKADRGALQALAKNRRVDLFVRIPHGTGQTYLRELLLVADHNAYHVGQLIAVRRALGLWRA